MLELGVRVALYVKSGDSVFLTYGFANTISNNNELYDQIYDPQGNRIYWKCKSSNNQRNPVNSHGFRGAEIMEKCPGKTRVLCFGGSTTYGLTLPYEETYPKLLQQALDLAAGRNHFEVINAGFPAFRLKQIIALYEHEVVNLNPDIVIIMNVFNNLVTDDKDFFYIQVTDKKGKLLNCIANKIIEKSKRYSLLVESVANIAQKGYRDFLKNRNWQKGANAIMRSTGLWENITADLQHFFSVLTYNNKAIRIIVLDEAMNTIDYPELAPPMNKAYQVQRAVCAAYKNVEHADPNAILNKAQLTGEKIWFASYYDPIHLSRTGNELLAAFVAEEILQAY